MPTAAEQFLSIVGNAAQRLGIRDLVIAVRDPRTQVATVVTSNPQKPGERGIDKLWTALGEKRGAAEGGDDESYDAEWPA